MKRRQFLKNAPIDEDIIFKPYEIEEYEVIYENTASALSREVSEHLAQGWVLYGQIFILDDYYKFNQVMIKYKNS